MMKARQIIARGGACKLLLMVKAGLLGASSLLSAQSSRELLALDTGVSRVSKLFTEHLLTDESSRWSKGWRLARDIGPAASPLLERLLERGTHPKERLVLIGACAAASKASVFIGADWLRKAGTNERMMSMLAVALGESRSSQDQDIHQMIMGRTSVARAVQVAGLLAIERFEGGGENIDHFLSTKDRRDDPGLVAAVTLSGGLDDVRTLQVWLDEKKDLVGRNLVRRGLFLARHGTPLPPAVLLRELSGVLGDDSVPLPVRAAAAARLSRVPSLRRVVASLPSAVADRPSVPVAQVLILLAFTPAGRAAALSHGWLKADPSFLIDDPSLRRRLAVLYALAAPMSKIVEAAPEWKGLKELAPSICLTLAWRIFAGDKNIEQDRVSVLGAIAESRWLSIALGEEFDAEPGTFADSRLDLAYGLASRGRLSDEAGAREIEEALWRAGSHPGCSLQEARLALVKDLLLSGSDHAKAREARTRPFGYLPQGIEPGSMAFEVAYEFFQWWKEGHGSGIPEDMRLR